MRSIPFSPPDITENEIEAVADTLRSGWITTGPKTKEFEKKVADFLGTSKAVALGSCTSALEMTLRILGIGEGDEVIVPAYTYTATAACVAHVGAKIVIVDTSPESFLIDPDKIAEAVTERTKAVIPVDIAGKMCDYESIFKVVESKNYLFKPGNKIQELFNRVIVVSDSAHGFGSSRHGVMSGGMADFTAFSLHAVKTITAAEGGIATWRDVEGLDNDWLYQQYMLYSLHGQTKDALHKNLAGSWEYDIVVPGYKCNMTDIQAAIALVQLERFKDIQGRRRDIIKMYDVAMDEMGIGYLHHVNEEFVTSCHIYLTRVPGIGHRERNEIINRMADLGVACNVHFKPLPMMSAYKNMGFNIDDYPNAYAHYKNEITLPLHTKLTDEDIQYVIDCYRKVLIDMHLIKA
ncbi:MAG: DegT/DnrJ/EryC1/StrS aminotransferase family protein [Acutalibacteraceae bacterium]|nr:DegT/DnrJ/EryC1/StrS aminotransferase family protein [Acutalibacteraceae bacterium]